MIGAISCGRMAPLPISDAVVFSEESGVRAVNPTRRAVMS